MSCKALAISCRLPRLQLSLVQPISSFYIATSILSSICDGGNTPLTWREGVISPTISPLASCSDTQSPSDGRRAAFMQRYLSHLPKQCSSGLIPSLRSQSPATFMHAQPLPRKPTAMKQTLAGLVFTSFLIKHGEWTHPGE